MESNKFKKYIIASESIAGDYGEGYRRGLRRFYHGANFGDDAEHQKWLNLSGHRQELGDGYRDGHAGKPPAGFHGGIGNQNASSEATLDTFVKFRVHSSTKEAFIEQSSSEGLSLSAWCQQTLLAACKTNTHRDNNE